MFDNAVALIWRRDTLYNGVQYRVGHLVPDSISSAKRKALWNSKRVELAPPGIDVNMLVPAARPTGFPDPVTDGDTQYRLDDLIAEAIEQADTTNADWNRITNEDQIGFITEVLTSKLPEVEEDDEEDESGPDSEKPAEDDPVDATPEKVAALEEVSSDVENADSSKEVEEVSSDVESTESTEDSDVSANADTPEATPAKVE